MSYDILFVPRRPGQSWEAALDEAEGRDVLGDALRPDRLAQWDRIVAALRHRVGEVEVSVGGDACEAVDPSSGLEVSLYPDEASVSFPYAERPDPAAFHDLVVDVVGLLERETGLRAWDAQTDEPFDGQVHDETGLAATRRIGQEASDTAATEGMAARAAAGHLGPDTGEVVLPAAALADAGTPGPGGPGAAGAPVGTPGDRTAGPDSPAELALQRRRSLRYVVVGVVVVVAALLLRSQGQASTTLSGLALALGVADVVIGLLLYRAWHRRAQAVAGGRAASGSPTGRAEG